MVMVLPTKRWVAQHPDRIQLYSVATPNGKKAGVMLEESGLPYEAHTVHIGKGDQHDPEFLAISPNGKIPAIVDPAGPGGEPLAIFESGAILLYLAEKSGKLLPEDPRLREEARMWLFFQVGGVGPFFGQFGHFHKFARDKTSDDYALTRYATETTRLLGVLEARLEGRSFLVGDELTVADVATFPWVQALDFYEGKERVEYDRFPRVEACVQRCTARPAVQRGLAVTPS